MRETEVAQRAISVSRIYCGTQKLRDIKKHKITNVMNQKQIKEWAKSNWFKVGVLLLGSIFIISYLWLNLKREAEKKGKSNQGVSIPPIETETENTPENTGPIIMNFKLDKKDADDLSELATEAIFNNTRGICSAIVANKTTKNHLYFLFLKQIEELETKYAQYRNRISIIDEGLNFYYTIKNIITDKCSSVGFKI